MERKSRKKPTVLSMFSGCGGMDLGFKQAGFRIVWANDFDADACSTYRQPSNKLGKIIDGDIARIQVPEIVDLDILVGGFPCQAYSNAGSRKGIGDKRGNLYEYCLQYIEKLRPRIVVFENVRGFLSIKGRHNRLIEEIGDALTKLRYTVYFNLVSAADHGVPQNRLRTFVIAISEESGISGLPFPKKITGVDLTIGSAILDISKDTPNQRDLLKLNPQAVELGKMVPPGGSWKDIPYESLPDRLKYIRNNMRKYRWPNFYRRFAKHEIAGTITAAFKPENAGVWHPTKGRVMSVREIARIQTFPDEFVFKARTVKAMYQMIGNAVPPKLAFELAKALKSALKGNACPQDFCDYWEVRELGKPIRPSGPPMIYRPRSTANTGEGGTK